MVPRSTIDTEAHGSNSGYHGWRYGWKLHIEPFNGLFKNVFEWGGQVSVHDLDRTRLIVLSAILLYQLVLLYQFEQNRPLGRGIKPLLRAA